MGFFICEAVYTLQHSIEAFETIEIIKSVPIYNIDTIICASHQNTVICIVTTIVYLQTGEGK